MKTYKELIGTFLRREDVRAHARADCDVVYADGWLEDCSPAYYYGLAHILKHEARRLTIEKPANWKEIYHFFGWTDEFFWLSAWKHSQCLAGRPGFESIDDPCELLFLARLSFEWGDLIREAWHYLRTAPPGFLAYLRQTANSAGAFSIWPDPKSRFARAFFGRAKKRFGAAQEILDRFDSMSGHRKAVKETADYLQIHLFLGQARLWSAYTYYADLKKQRAAIAQKEAQGFIDKAKKFPAPRDLRRLVENLARKARSSKSTRHAWDGPLRGESEKPTGGDLAAVYMLGGWLGDLLLTSDSGAHHPRLHVPKIGDQVRQHASFPNVPCIEHLDKRLSEHKSWLRFLVDGGSTYMDSITAVEKLNESLKGMALERDEPKSEKRALNFPSQRSAPRCWEFFVLRDWASYTPLLPPGQRHQVRRPLGYGGGYFLRYKGTGIVIDPGFDFIRNFYAAKCHPSMITDIVVTHDHYDHVASFGPLLNLLRVVREKQRYPKSSSPKADQQGSVIKTNFFLSRGVFAQYGRSLIDFGYFGRVEPLTDQDSGMNRIHRLTDGITLHTTHTEHGDSGGFGHGVGLLFAFAKKLKLPALGISSDTGWYSWSSPGAKTKVHERSLAETFAGGVGHRSRSPGIMVLHVGSLKREELRDSGYYRTHLGARGVFLSISGIPSCRLVLLGEFGEECRDHRVWFADALTRYFGNQRGCGKPQFRCFPTDRMTYVRAQGGTFLIGRHDQMNALIPYEQAVAQMKEADGTLCFRRRHS